MSNKWHWCNDYEYTDPSGVRYDITEYVDGSRLQCRLNAMQAVVDAAKAARDTTKGHFIDLVGADAIFAALAKLEAK